MYGIRRNEWLTVLLLAAAALLSAPTEASGAPQTTPSVRAADAAPTASRAVLFADDFASGTLARWTPSPLGLFSGWSAASGSAVYDGGGHTQIYAGDPLWSDYSVRARFRLATGLNYPGGLRGRVDRSSGVCYAAWIFPELGTIRLLRTAGWHVDTPGIVVLGEAAVGTIAPGVFHTLRLTFAGDTILVGYDGQTILVGTDAALASGAIALDVSSQPIAFDDVEVLQKTVSTDATPPAVMLTAPTIGATVAGTVALTALASDDSGMVGVTFEIDGAALGPEDASPPFAASWDTTSLLDGTHRVAAVARDAAGNEATDALEVFVSNGIVTAGPGGPILVVVRGTNPFARYCAELLSAEGLNAFAVIDVAFVTPALLAGYDVVVLGEIPLTTAQASLFSAWVTAGGNLIAMRPDPALAGLCGLTPAGGTLSDGYLEIDTSAPPGRGIVGETLQFHGEADLYTPGGAAVVATLYSGATTPTIHPAVTLASVGGSGGQAAAFAFDLARSVVTMRQGNPAWAGQDRDGLPPVRTNDLFFGAAAFDPQPDWIDFDKVAIPQADEEQRLLANLILAMNADKKPLPRFWYLPRGEKAVVLMTGDDHGAGGTAGRLNTYAALSAPGCSVDDWECVRSTSYMYASTPFTDAEAASFDALGFEVGIHVDTGCAAWTPASLDAFYASQIAAWTAKYASVAAPLTHRVHCGAWTDYTTHAKVEAAHGIRLDTNYYTWPGSWILDRPGFFTGSGLPLRWADENGAVIDIYQVPTQMTDESGQSYPFTVDTLLANALGSKGYYGVLTANMHTDSPPSVGSDAIVAAAAASGVPIVSARQVLAWLDGRNGSSFAGIAWDGLKLGFTVVAGAGSNGLTALVPAASAGGALTAVQKNGGAHAFTLETIKGISYAVFAAPAGVYSVVYGG